MPCPIRKYLPFPSFCHHDLKTIHTLTSSESSAGNFRALVRAIGKRQHLHGTNNPATVADWKTALDATVIAQGTMKLIFILMDGFCQNSFVQLIDYAVRRYGKKSNSELSRGAGSLG